VTTSYSRKRNEGNGGGGNNNAYCAIAPVDGDADGEALSLCRLFNATGTPARFKLPHAGNGRRWPLLVDTSRSSADPADDAASTVEIDASALFTLEAHAMVMLGVAPSGRTADASHSTHDADASHSTHDGTLSDRLARRADQPCFDREPRT
jgi:hypothetical protein